MVGNAATACALPGAPGFRYAASGHAVQHDGFRVGTKNVSTGLVKPVAGKPAWWVEGDVVYIKNAPKVAGIFLGARQ